MIVALIVAVAENGAIGARGTLPWRLPADLKRFKALTMGHHLVLGRRTFESLLGPLPGRRLIVLSRDPHYRPPGCLVAGDLPAALDLARQAGEDELFIAGGAQVYARALPLADRLYLTRVHTEVEGDTFFPTLDAAHWQVMWSEHHAADERHPYAFTFLVYERRPETPPTKPYQISP